MKISVLTTLFNHERFIRTTLECALTQTLIPYEIIVLDDASTDRSLSAAREFESPLVRVLSSPANLGGANTVRALASCSGDLVAILNSDDLWAPDKLEKQQAHLACSPNTGVVFTHVTTIDEHGKPWHSDRRWQKLFQFRNRSRHDWLRHFFLVGNPFCASSALVRMECFERLGPFNGSYIQLQDMDMWIRMAVAGYDLHVVEQTLTSYRVMRDGSNMSFNDSGNRAANTFEYAKTLRNYWQVKSLDELLRIFPEIRISDQADDSLMLFYLASYASKLPSAHHRLFALETMAQWGGNFEAMSLAQECHGFGFKQYRDFFTHGPVRDLLRLNFRHQMNSIAVKLLPYSITQWLKGVIGPRS